MAKIIVGVALMIYCGPDGAAAMMALYGAIASTGFSMAGRHRAEAARTAFPVLSSLLR